MKVNSVNTFKPVFKANKMSEKQALYLNNKLLSSDKVDIFCHSATDEDAFNSAKTLYTYLEQKGKHPRIVASRDFDNYDYDENKYNIIHFEDVNSDTQKADLAACVDFSKKERLADNVLDYLMSFDESHIVGIDHHNEDEYVIDNTNHITKSYSKENPMPDFEEKNYYIDSTAKSCSSIIYRFFEALNIIPSKEQLKSLFCGMTDDMTKSNYVKLTDDCHIKHMPKLKDNPNVKEVYEKIENMLTPLDKQEIIQHLNVLAGLSPDEKDFQNKLFNNVRLNNNNTFAYVVLDPDDAQWLRLGGDNKRTSTIMRDFRVRMLAHNYDDKQIPNSLKEKLNNLQAAAVFYSNPEEKCYRISIHSKNDCVQKYNDYIREHLNPGLIAGGHANRGGGRIFTLESEKWQNWVQDFVTASENIEEDYKNIA